MSKAISVSTGPIFTIFSQNGRNLREFSPPGKFSDFSRDVAMATNFVSYQTCSLKAKVSEDTLDRFSESLYHMVGIELQKINPAFFSRYLQGCCQGNQFSGKIVAKLPTPCSYRIPLSVRINSVDNAISCGNFVKFGPVTSELTELICKHHARHGQTKLAHLYIRTYWTNFRNLFTI